MVPTPRTESERRCEYDFEGKKTFLKIVYGRGANVHDPCVGQKAMLDPLELKMVMSHLLWVLDPQIESSVRAMSSINC